MARKPTVTKTMDTKTILHIIRNPYGFDEKEVRQARLEAADEIEQLSDMLVEANNRRSEMEARAVSMFHLLPAETLVGDLHALRNSYKLWRAAQESKKVTGPYRVEAETDKACTHCRAGTFWTIVRGQGDDEIACGQSYGDEDLTHDICDLMNMAYDAAKEEDASDSDE